MRLAATLLAGGTFLTLATPASADSAEYFATRSTQSDGPRAAAADRPRLLQGALHRDRQGRLEDGPVDVRRSARTARCTRSRSPNSTSPRIRPRSMARRSSNGSAAPATAAGGKARQDGRQTRRDRDPEPAFGPELLSPAFAAQAGPARHRSTTARFPPRCAAGSSTGSTRTIPTVPRRCSTPIEAYVVQRCPRRMAPAGRLVAITSRTATRMRSPSPSRCRKAPARGWPKATGSPASPRGALGDCMAALGGFERGR